MTRRSTPKGFAETKTPYTASRTGEREANELVPGKRKLPQPETLSDGTIRYFLTVGPKGRVLLPADMRAAMGLREGDAITGWLKDGEVRMHSHVYGLRKIRSEAASQPKGAVYASDELIAERRAEAAKEDEETSRWLRERKRKS